MLSPDSILHDRYKIVRLLKAGSMGAVYLAFDLRLNTRVAVKELHLLAENISEKNSHAIRTAFAAEAALLANLNHPAIPRAHDFFEENHTSYLVMELVEGVDLAELLQRQRGNLLDAHTIFEWADGLLDALEYLHAQNAPVIHRDIKPSNIKITPDGQIKLLDFGIAKGVMGLQTQQSPSEASLRMATLEYAPPEQAVKACPEWRALLANTDSIRTQEILASRTDVRTDLFALAATVYRLLTAQLPADSLARAFAVWNDKPDPLVPIRALRADVSPEISAVLMQALALTPAERPVSATQLRRDLQSLRCSAAPPESKTDEQLAARVKQLERRLRDETEYRRQVEAKWLNLESLAAQQKQEIERTHRHVETAHKRLLGAEAARVAAETDAARFKKIIVQFLTEIKSTLSDAPGAPRSNAFDQTLFPPVLSHNLYALESLIEVRDNPGSFLAQNRRYGYDEEIKVIG